MPTVTTVRTDLRRGINAGAAFKVPCKVATTAAITLAGEQTIDGVAVVADDSVLVKNQADATFNGIYWVATGAWTRRPDFNGYFDAKHGTLVWVNQGSTNALTLWRVSTSDISAGQGPLPDGTSSIAFTEVELGGAAAASATFFSAYRSTDQTSGTTVIFDNETTNGSIATSAYNNSTGVLTIPSGITIGRLEATVIMSPGTEGAGNVRVLQILVNSQVHAQQSVLLSDSLDYTAVLSTGYIALTAGHTCSVTVDQALSSTNGKAVGSRATRFSGIFFEE